MENVTTMYPRRRENPHRAAPQVKGKGDAKNVDRILQTAWDAGWWVERGGRHLKCYSPDGKAIVIVPTTPSKGRGLANLKAEFRRAGLQI